MLVNDRVLLPPLLLAPLRFVGLVRSFNGAIFVGGAGAIFVGGVDFVVFCFCGSANHYEPSCYSKHSRVCHFELKSLKVYVNVLI